MNIEQIQNSQDLKDWVETYRRKIAEDRLNAEPKLIESKIQEMNVQAQKTIENFYQAHPEFKFLRFSVYPATKEGVKIRYIKDSSEINNIKIPFISFPTICLKMPDQNRVIRFVLNSTSDFCLYKVIGTLNSGGLKLNTNDFFRFSNESSIEKQICQLYDFFNKWGCYSEEVEEA